MKGSLLPFGIFAVIASLKCKISESSVVLDNLINVFDLTSDNYAESLAEKHHFVLFYSSG